MPWFRLKAGAHASGAAETFKAYRKGDVFEAAADLAALDPGKYEPADAPALAAPSAPAPKAGRFGLGAEAPAGAPAGWGDRPKDADADADADAEAEGDGLESLTVADLKDLATEEEIDLQGAHLKADIVAAIREARA
jgi:hypothetical protein